ncbi:MAG: hypothetical protein LBE57_05905 [Methanosarcinales archaeon]|jgi:hypothetical protein|nr:hypothetical protein [Methanosarcinales archaeon]
MSIEIESDFSVIKIKGEKYLQTVLLEQSAGAVEAAFCGGAVYDKGISYIRSEWSDSDFEDIEIIREFHRVKDTDELIGFRRDPDYEDDNCGFENSDRYDSLLPYDYETDIADVLNLDEQIAHYAANSWEFVSMTDNIILFQRPKWEA